MSAKPSLFTLGLGALGVVYGTIGISTLYAVNQVFFGQAPLSVTVENVYGAISLMVWILTLIVSVEYMIFVMRADNRGEGGMFALFGLLDRQKFFGASVVMALILLAAGLRFSDAFVTPPIVVLSAVEGLSIVTEHFTSFVVPIVIVILSLLFAIQHKGTASIGKLFGPVIFLWCVVISFLGLFWISTMPGVLNALNPVHGILFLGRLGIRDALAVLGPLFLIVTGVEAIYADLGHFGRKPVRYAWYFVVFPAIVLNCLGQGAYLLSGSPVLNGNIFFSLVPVWGLIPMIVLATMATIIASQALITATFSMVAQAIGLGLMPRVKIEHTSPHIEGQIYVPAVNWILYIGSVTLVLLYQTSIAIGPAYGRTVAGVLAITSVAMIPLAVLKWQWGRTKAVAFFGTLALMELIFFIANSRKIVTGGYLLFLAAALFCTAIVNWQWGRKRVGRAFAAYGHQRIRWLLDLKKALDAEGGRVVTEEPAGSSSGQAVIRRLVELPRTVVVLASRPVESLEERVPVVFRRYLKSTGALPEKLIFLTIVRLHVPRAEPEHRRLRIVDFGSGISAVHAYYGFLEFPDPYDILGQIEGLPDLEECMIQVADEQISIDPGTPFFMRLWARLFRIQSHIASRSYGTFGFRNDARLMKIPIPVVFSAEGARVAIVDRDREGGV